MENNYKELLQNATRESDYVTNNFLNNMHNRNSSDEIKNVASNWSSYSLEDKKEVSRDMVGVYQSGRFATLMNQLSS